MISILFLHTSLLLLNGQVMKIKARINWGYYLEIELEIKLVLNKWDSLKIINIIFAMLAIFLLGSSREAFGT